MPTLKDVARDAGVSIATVSCCLSGSRNVRPETKMKIMDSIEKLKYIPNASARSLKKTSTNSIGVVLADIAESYHAEIFKGISSCLQKNGYTTNVAFSNNAAYMERQIIEDFIGQNVAGLLILTCMPEHTEFFQNRIKGYGIPSVFIEHQPENMEASFVGFDNRETIYRLTSELLDSHYKKIALICGFRSYSCEADSIQGYRQALEDHGLSFDAALVQETNMSREDSFQTALSSLDLNTLDAVITTSENIACGVLEALKVQNLSIPEDLLLLTLGEESWNQASRLPGVIYTARTAFPLGEQAAKMLLQKIQTPLSPEQSLFLNDRIPDPWLFPPAAKNASDQSASDQSAAAQKLPSPCGLGGFAPLRLLLVELSTSRAAQLLAQNFTQSTGIPLEIDLIPHDQMLSRILTDAQRSGSPYDIYMYDIVWQEFIGQNQLTADISDYITGESFPREALFPHLLESGRYNGRYYGVPFIAGSHIMFYRKDLFEDHAIAREYRKRYQTSLRPPRTWKEFNRTAEFFTRSCNPGSPTLFGTSISGIMDEELAPELLIRLWAFGGALWDRYNRAALDTPECQKAFLSLLETISCTDGRTLESSIMRNVSDFSEGKTAMLVTYSEYASQVSKAMYQNIIGQVGYRLLPERTALSVGWFLGVNPYSSRQTEAYRYFDWLCQERTGCYMTILGGQPPVTAPYHSHELLKLYPWMELTEPSFSCCKKRLSPGSPNALVIPRNRIEQILCSAFRDVLTGRLPLKDSLEKWQKELEKLFRSYGYPKPVHFII